MSTQEKLEVLAHVEEAWWGKRKLLAELRIPRSTYYRWRAQQLPGKPDILTGSARIPWNKLSLQEENTVLATAREAPELSSRQLAAWITDHQSLSVGESTVYRLLQREGLVKPPEMKLLAGKEYQRKTSAPQKFGPLMHRIYIVFPSGRLGLLLHGDRDGRLFPIHSGLETTAGHDL